MGNKGKKSDPKLSRAEQLIQAAVRSLEESGEIEEVLPPKTEAGVHEIEEVPESDPARETGRIAKIDLKQFVDKEAYLRLAADFENFRKRSLKERQDAERTGKEKILREFLEILDNLDRGLQQAPDDQSALASGMRMVLSQAEGWLKSQNLERVETLGKNFDPQFHEAVSQEDSTLPAGTVIRELKRGYRWGDRLLRPASVVVSKG